MQHRRSILVRSAAFPLFDDGYGLLDRFVSDREIIPAGGIRGIIIVFLKESLDELISCKAVDRYGSVIGNDHSVRRLIKNIALRSDEFFQNVIACLKLSEFDQAGSIGNDFTVISASGETELRACDAVARKSVVVLPDLKTVVWLIDDSEFTVNQRIHDIVAVHIINCNFSCRVAVDCIDSVKQNMIVVGRDLCHLIRAHLKVNDMDNAVTVGRYDHIDRCLIIGITGDRERDVRKRDGVIAPVYRAAFIEIKVAVDTGRVAQHPHIGILIDADHKTVVNGPVVLALAHRLAYMYDAVLVDRDRHLGVVLKIIVYAVDFLEIIRTSRDIVEQYPALRVRRQSGIDIIIVMRSTPETENYSRDRNELSGGLVDLRVDLKDLNIRDLAETDLSVILMVDGEIVVLGILSEFDRVQQIDVVERDRIGCFARDRVGCFHKHGHGDGLVGVENELLIIGGHTKIYGKSCCILKVGIVGAVGRDPDIVMIRKNIIRVNIEGFDKVSGECLGIVKFPVYSVGSEHAHVKALQNTVPVG